MGHVLIFIWKKIKSGWFFFMPMKKCDRKPHQTHYVQLAGEGCGFKSK